MQSTLAYTIQGLAHQSPVTAFCIDHQTSYVAQTVKQATVITACHLDDSTASATADLKAQITLPNLVNVHSLALIASAPKLSLLLCGQPTDANGQPNAPELWRVSVDTGTQDQQLEIFKITHLESANITGTPLPGPVIGAVSALSSDRSELAVMVLDRGQHLQGTVYNLAQMSHLLRQLTAHGQTTIEAGNLKMMATVYQSFKPNTKQLAPETIGSIQSISFSNGRALYATKSYGDEHAVSKGFWLLKNGFHDQPIDQLPENTVLTGIALLGKYVYFGQSQHQANGDYLNTIQRVEKTLWK
ncbi:helveticin J family class III bacteriocin [Secundilactobacillus silagei]|uniref:Uncharacterized protein n=1 Tax=Secundilactobacillus silagei JCM 19001 TaxID=1302250 RepID=A0A1Z5IJU4_9LACO|nr:helveticin J family class III bacteriocin [Secundilactobacillus silagei]TDG71284.1 hypothetical protein C5L25_001200 [Secundilactobacillus silagei JCM 19001]GAX02047.1 hypothetical protein IWT126_02111 [Secundilactobacillus silagei JCM 19001]